MRPFALLFLVISAAAHALLCQSQPTPAPAFEVASVKPVDPASQEPIGMFTYPGGRLVITKLTLKQMIASAWSVDMFRVERGPAWADQDRYDVEARPPASSASHSFSPSSFKSPPTPEMLLMLQNLLTDRFHLQVHHETKDDRGWALTVAPKGARLTPTKDPTAYRYVGGGVTGKPELPNFISGENASTALIAARLSNRFGATILDQTGIRGDFDFKVEYARDEDAAPGPPPALISAMQEQLGLRLTQIKTQVETVVIDHAEKASAN